MKSGWFLGIVCAVLLHAGFVLFGGWFLPEHDESASTTKEVELLSDVESTEKEKEQEKEPPPDPEAEQEEQLEAEAEAPPDAAEVMRNLELAAVSSAPKLDAASLGAIEAALSGLGGGGEFAEALSFASGGVIGGTGRAGAVAQQVDAAFALAEIDQKPRALFQATALYPAELRSKKLEGVVSLIFVVDASGKVTDPRVEKSTHQAFEKPALAALKQWKFEPAVKGGQRVACRMRVPIRFQPR